MKKYIIVFCLITLLGCSKNENDFASSSLCEEISHISNYDLALVDDSIQLITSREEAIKRGVPSSEYDRVEEALIRHNERTIDLLKRLGKEKSQTRSNRSGNTMAFGMLQDPPVYYMNYYTSNPLNVANEFNTGGIILSYTLVGYNSSSSDKHVLRYAVTGPIASMGEIERYGYTIEDFPIPGFTFGWVSLEYSYSGFGYGICIFQIIDNT